MFETMDTLTKEQADALIKWFVEAIGTDYELNESASGEPNEYYVVFFDIEEKAEWELLDAYLKEHNITEA